MNEPYAVAPAASSFSGVPPLRPAVSAQTIGPKMMAKMTIPATHSTLARLLEHFACRVEIAIRVFLEDPLALERIEHVDPILVAHAKRAVAERRAADHAPWRAHAGSTSSNGWCARTSCPFSAKMRRTCPEAVERISLKSFI